MFGQFSLEVVCHAMDAGCDFLCDIREHVLGDRDGFAQVGDVADGA